MNCLLMFFVRKSIGFCFDVAEDYDIYMLA